MEKQELTNKQNEKKIDKILPQFDLNIAKKDPSQPGLQEAPPSRDAWSPRRR